MKSVVAAFNQEKALVGAFSVITNLRMQFGWNFLKHYSRMTEGIIPAEMLEQLAPEHIAPVVAWLCHEDCPASGQVVEALAGWAGAYRWQRSQGAVLGQVRSLGHMVTRSHGHKVT